MNDQMEVERQFFIVYRSMITYLVSFLQFNFFEVILSTNTFSNFKTIMNTRINITGF